MSAIVLAVIVLTALIVLLACLVLLARSWLLPQGSILININSGHQVSVAAGLKLLNALNESGIPIPSACAGAGTCGLCKVTVLDGAGHLLPIEKARLSPKECSTGVRLACQVTVREPMMINVAEDILSAESWRCELVSTRNLSPLIKELSFALPDSRPFNFEPGSYLQVTAPPVHCNFAEFEISDEHRQSWDRLGISGLVANSDTATTRAYSIASTPADAGRIVLLIRLALPPPGQRHDLPPGIVSSWLFNLKQGETAELSGPFGDFKATGSEREMVLIGGGVGMAPLRAIIHQQLARGFSKPIYYFYGARSREDLFYQNEFDQLSNEHPHFTWSVALSEPSQQDNWNGAVGFVHQIVKSEFLDTHPHPQACDYYLCGPPLMLKAVTAMLQDAGVAADQILADDFGS